jgi:hypothetical protein
MTREGILDAPVTTTEYFHMDSMLEANIQKWGRGAAVAGDEEVGQLGTANSELEQSVADASASSPSPAASTFNPTAGGNLPFHKDGNPQEIKESLEKM